MTQGEGKGDASAWGLDEIVEEIRAEARRKRESGEYPAALERDLDALFEDLVPERLNEHDFEAVLDRAERASLIDLHAPIDDERPMFSRVKRGVQKLILWYMEYVVRQLSTFAGATTRAVRLLGDRLERLEERHDILERRLPDVGDGLDLVVAEPALDEGVAAAIVDAFRSVDGRVLHADAGDGSLVERLRTAGVDAYGTDPRAPEEGVDLRRAPILDHLRLVGEGALAGLVLSGFVDHAPQAAKVATVDLAAGALASGGVLLIAGTSPEAWERAMPAPLVDLAPGRPFRPDTWRLLLERCGFEEITVTPADGEGTATGASSYLVAARRPQ